MKKFDSDESSASEGEISNSDEETTIQEPPTKPSKRKIWSNVVLDQAVDDIGNVNTFSGNSGNRDVESYGTFSRKRRLSEIEEDSNLTNGKNGESAEPGEDMEEEESEFDSLLKNAEGGSGKRKKVVYDVSTHCSEEEDLLDSVDALDSQKKNVQSEKGNSELDFTLGDAIMESSRFLSRVDKKHKRPHKTCPPEEALDYLVWALNETNVDLLKRLLRLKSIPFVFAALDETIKTEREGGIMTNSGIRRRLPGGVFIAHLKKRLTEFERFIVLDGKSEIEANRELENRKKKKKASQLRKQKKRKEQKQRGLLTTSKKVEVQDLNDLILENVNAEHENELDTAEVTEDITDIVSEIAATNQNSSSDVTKTNEPTNEELIESGSSW